MTRPATILAALLLAAAQAHEQPLPVPPIPPRDPPAYQPAPVPDQTITGPAPPRSDGITVTPGLFNPRTEYRGEGFSPGSTSQGFEERKQQPVPGLRLGMPLR